MVLHSKDASGRRYRVFTGRLSLALALTLLIIVTGLLWVDSNSSEREFIFIPGGDVAYGFLTREKQISFVEHAGWVASPNLEILTFPLAGIIVLEASILVLIVLGAFRKRVE